MSQSFTSLHVHLIFGTKHREPVLDWAWQAELHKQIAGIIRHHAGIPIAVGGYTEHVHCLLGLPATMAMADMARFVKTNSSRWIRESKGQPNFAWQAGYSAFTVSRSQLDRVAQYIENQRDHHSVRSFADEMAEFLCRHGFDAERKE